MAGQYVSGASLGDAGRRCRAPPFSADFLPPLPARNGDGLQDNLRREQRAVMDLNCVTISKILTPLQVGPEWGGARQGARRGGARQRAQHAGADAA